MKSIEDLRVLIDRIPYAEGNIGEEAILTSLLQDLEACGIRNISVLSNQPERTHIRHGNKINVISDDLGSWPLMPFNIRKYDLLIWGGGHMLQDRSSQLYIPCVTKNLLLAKLTGIPRFIYAPGLGPIVNRLGKFLSKLAINGSGKIIVRDEESFDLLKKIGITGEIHQTADPAFSLQTVHNNAQFKKMESTVIGLAPRKLFYRKGSILPVRLQQHSDHLADSQFMRFIAETAAALDLLIEKCNARIALFPMDIGPNPRDDLVCQQISCQMVKSAKVKIYDDDPPLGIFIRRMAGLDLLISARLHGIILGLRFGLPFIGIDSDGKIFRLANKIGMDDFVIRDEDFERYSIFNLVCKALDSKKELTGKLFEQGSKLKTEAQENCNLLKLYLNALSEKN